MRGYILTEKGIEKIENIGKTQEQIATDSLLNRATVSKALQADQPLNKSSIRRLFRGLELTLENNDYRPFQVQSIQLNLDMNDRQDLIKSAESLEALASDAEKRGDVAEAERLKKEAANLRRIAAK